MSNEEPETIDGIVEECTRIAETYQKARDIHIDSEAITRERDWTGLVNFRDGLDHMVEVITELDEGNTEKALEELNRVEEHLERAIYDGKKRIPDQKLGYIRKNRLPSLAYTLALYDAPNSTEFKRQMRLIKQKYAKGRQAFPEGSAMESMKYFEEATEIATRLEEETPPKREIYFRLLTIFGVLVTVTAGGYTVFSG